MQQHPSQLRPYPLHLGRQGRVIVEAQPVEHEPLRPGRPRQTGMVHISAYVTISG